MKRTALAALAAGVVAAAFLVPAQASSSMVSHRLIGVTGPGFTVEVKQGTKDVKTLRAGTYTIKVEDKSNIHNFHLFGPGVNKKTTVPFKGVKTWTVKLKKGRDTYQCDIHAATGMRGHFRVT
jgi:plastocyanin